MNNSVLGASSTFLFHALECLFKIYVQGLILQLRYGHHCLEV